MKTHKFGQLLPFDVEYVEYCFTEQLFYGYRETDGDNDNEIDRNSDLHLKDKGSFTFHNNIT